MPHLEPHHLALFSLIPDNDQAHAILAHPDTIHLVSLIPNTEWPENPDRVVSGLNIGFHIGSKSRYTLATLGRSGADITVEGSNISRIQCSFEICQATNKIMLYDRSNSMSTQLCGRNAVPFELGRKPRRVVVDRSLNDEFGFGGDGCNLVRFKICWHMSASNVRDQINNREDSPCFARTMDETPTVQPFRRVTRIHYPGNGEPEIRYADMGLLGSGQFAEVRKIVNIGSGEIMAVKRIRWPEQQFQSRGYAVMKREVEIWGRTSNPNIVEFISAQGRGKEYLEIFMALKEGSVGDLICADLFMRHPESADPLLHQMLQALDYLAHNSIVHRDVKPPNILYTSLPAGGYTFQLADFGLCNIITDARTYAGSSLFMAPEVLNNPGVQQTSKVDVWSLFVTLAYAMDVGGYRKKPFHTNELKIRAVQEAANEQILRPFKVWRFSTLAEEPQRQRCLTISIMERDAPPHGAAFGADRWRSKSMHQHS